MKKHIVLLIISILIFSSFIVSIESINGTNIEKNKLKIISKLLPNNRRSIGTNDEGAHPKIARDYIF